MSHQIVIDRAAFLSQPKDHPGTILNLQTYPRKAMKAIRVHQTGGPEVLTLDDIPTPEPGAGEVLVKIEAAGLNFIDTYHRTGLYPLDLPFVPGLEAAGVIEVEDRDEKICPATGILNNIILQVLTAQFTDEMCRRGAVPYFWMGVYRVGGAEYNGVMGDFFRERGY